ncbi:MULTISPECIES: hypothetical protein [Bartonella]|uniref:hypothetical protein n=1 Tax=Bartonella TaxID=773 RepID=UPI0018DDA47F|nr:MULTISPECIES: hypothetical protein [Bartonella]MBI0169081.1 hypothetical protein [Bartonella sp. W8167]MBI0174931.1 hypothetical protein [Bartonella apis]
MQLVCFIKVFLRLYRLLPLTLVLIVATSIAAPSAYAIDNDAFVKRFSESFGKSVTVSYGNVLGDGDHLTLDNVRITGTPISPDTSLGKVEFSGIKEEDHGGYSIEKVAIPQISYVYEGNTIKVANVTFSNVTLPPNKGLYNQNIGFRYQNGQFNKLELQDNAKKRLAMLEKGSVSLHPSIRENPIDFTINIKKITVFVDNFPDGSTKKDFIAMGYKNATGRLDISGAYGGYLAMMDLKHFHLVLDKGGVLDVSLKMDGMTLDSLLTVVTLQRENERGHIKSTQMWLGMLAQVQRYNFYGGKLKFEDHSITQKLVNTEAKRLGISADALKAKWKTGLPGWLSFAKGTNFENEAQKAVTAYLDTPRSLEISSTPMDKLPVIMLAISGKLSPKEFVRELNLAISANK